MFKNISDFISIFSLAIISLYMIRVFIWSIAFEKSDNNNKKTIFEEFLNYIDNEDE